MVHLRADPVLLDSLHVSHGPAVASKRGEEYTYRVGTRAATVSHKDHLVTISMEQGCAWIAISRGSYTPLLHNGGRLAADPVKAFAAAIACIPPSRPKPVSSTNAAIQP